jgi:hypothetical protein
VFIGNRRGGPTGVCNFVFRANLRAELPPAPPERREIAEWGWFALDRAPTAHKRLHPGRAQDGVRLGECVLTVVGERTWFE